MKRCFNLQLRNECQPILIMANTKTAAQMQASAIRRRKDDRVTSFVEVMPTGNVQVRIAFEKLFHNVFL